jgi:integrase
VAGVPPTHGFRHGMASQLVADGVDIRTIADRMGHATTSFTLATYVHSIDGKDRAAADRLGEQFQSMKDRGDKA